MNRHRRHDDCYRCNGRGWVWYYFWFPQCPVCEGSGAEPRHGIRMITHESSIIGGYLDKNGVFVVPGQED